MRILEAASGSSGVPEMTRRPRVRHEIWAKCANARKPPRFDSLDCLHRIFHQLLVSVYLETGLVSPFSNLPAAQCPLVNGANPTKDSLISCELFKRDFYPIISSNEPKIGPSEVSVPACHLSVLESDCSLCSVFFSVTVTCEQFID